MPDSVTAASATASRTNAAAGRRPPVNLLALSFYWLPNNLFWTVMLQAFLPSRVAAMVGDAHKGTYLFYISAIGAVATTVIQLIIGPISDACVSRMGRRHPFILWGTLLAAVAIIGFALAQNFIALVVAFFGIQLFLNVATGPYQALMPDTVSPGRTGLASAYMGAAVLIGQLAGVAILFGIATLHFTLLSVLCGIVALLLIGMAITVTQVPDAPASAAEGKTPIQALRSLQRLGIRKYRDFFGLLYSRFFINLSYATVTSFLLYYLQDAVGPKSKAPINQVIVILVATVAGLVGTLLVGRFADKISKKQLVYMSCGVLAFGAMVFTFATNMPVVILVAFLFGAGWGAFSAVDWALAVNLLPEAEGGAARYMAVWHVCLTMPQVIAPAFGPIADRLNQNFGHGLGWRVAMLSTVVYLGIGARLLHRIREKPLEQPLLPLID